MDPEEPGTIRHEMDVLLQAQMFDPASDVLTVVGELCGPEVREALAGLTPGMVELGVCISGPKHRQAEVWMTSGEGEIFLREGVQVKPEALEIAQVVALEQAVTRAKDAENAR